MPVLIEPQNPTGGSLLGAMPAGTHIVGSYERLLAWLDTHPDEYAVVLGPELHHDDALKVTEEMRLTRPLVSVVVVAAGIDTDLLSRAFKAGARDVVRMGDLAEVSAAVRRAEEFAEALRGPGAGQSGRVVNVFSPKGGVGKTTVAVNLAVALNETGRNRVCLVDLDLAFGDVAITLQIFPDNTIEQAVGSEESIDASMLEALMTRHGDSLMVLAAPSSPEVRERVSPTLVSRILRILRTQFDFVVIDSAPALDDVSLAALDETDECVIVATLDVPTLKNVKVALETLDALDIARDHRHLLLNRADESVGLGQQKVEEVLAMKVSARLGTATEIAAATNAGTPIVKVNPTHASAQAFKQLAAAIDPETETADAGAPGASGHKRGLLRRRDR